VDVAGVVLGALVEDLRSAAAVLRGVVELRVVGEVDVVIVDGEAEDALVARHDRLLRAVPSFFTRAMKLPS
jgi:hypothetical protein